MTNKPKPLDINGSSYYTKEAFAVLTNRSLYTIDQLVSKGNSIRKLRISHSILPNCALIPAEELIEFPFTTAGRKPMVYHYTENGEIEYV